MKRLRDKILSKTINECIDDDLYWYGECYIKKVYNIMTSIKSLNKEFTIQFDREDSKYCSGEYNYICHMYFYNDIGVEILDLKFTERYAFNLINSLYQFSISKNEIMNMIISTVDTDLSDYFLVVDRGMTEENLYTMSINKYLRLMDKVDTVVKLYLTDNLLEDMIYMMYFSYLIDIDDGDNYVTYFEKNKFVDWD